MPLRVFSDAQVKLLQEFIPELVELQSKKRSQIDFWDKVLHAYHLENPGPESDYQPPPPAVKLTSKGKISKRQPKTRVQTAVEWPSLQAWQTDREKVPLFRLKCRKAMSDETYGIENPRLVQ